MAIPARAAVPTLRPSVLFRAKVDRVIETQHSPTYRSRQVVIVPVFDDRDVPGAARLSFNTPTGRIELLVETHDAASRLTIGQELSVELVPMGGD